MKRVCIGVCALLLAGLSQLSADTAIGLLTLSADPNLGYQTVSFGNFMGGAQGCTVGAAQYVVCTDVNVTNWTLELDFTAEVSGLTSPRIFSSTDPTSDSSVTIAPVSNTNPDFYSGESNNAWVLPLTVQNDCNPICDAQITKIIFSGTVDQSTLQLYNGSLTGPYTQEFLSSQQFSTTWMIPASDYVGAPGLLFDSTDVTISDQPVAPEPGTGFLILAAAVAVGLFQRAGLLKNRC
jgi:hypothetical protein